MKRACRGRFRLAGAVLLFTLAFALPARAELPPPGANMELIPAGSLIIAMDNDKQNIGAVFNLKAYGLANHLLWESVAVKWAIRSGKAKDGIDFSVMAQRILPTAIGPAMQDFRGGPFIVHRDWAAFALSKITAFGNNVAVYETTADVMVDVRFTLDERKKVGVLDDGGNAAIHSVILDEAGFVAGVQYEVIPAATLITVNANACFTMVAEPHWDTAKAGVNNDNETEAIRIFTESGGNFLAQCAAIESYENNAAQGYFQSTLGIVENNLANASHVYPNPDLAYSQFHGALADTGGSVRDYELAPGSVFQNGTHSHAHNATDPSLYIATASKLVGGDGSNVFYLGGHNYKNASLGDTNGRRMYMNAAMMPSDRPLSCGFAVPPTPPDPGEISGTVYEDVNGDSNLADAVGAGGVRVRLYRDSNDNGVVDAVDSFTAVTTTDVDGDYTLSFGVVGDDYLVAVDSATVPPSGGYTGGAGLADIQPEQTYGDNPATAILDLGARFGGVDGATADDVDAASTIPADNVYEHLARVDLSGGNVAGVDFGFSFNAVVNVNAGGQGGLSQFIDNANGILGANAMRFVPSVPTNAAGGGGNWWSISTAGVLPAITDALTTIDGTAYSAANGTSVRDDNASSNGAGGTVGIDNLPLPTLDPELQLVGIGAPATGININAANATVRGMAIYGFGDRARDRNKANIRVGQVTGTLIELNVLGATAGSFTNPGSAAIGDNIRVDMGDSGTIRNNLIGFSGGNGIGMKDDSNTWLVQGNEIRGNGTNKTEAGAVDLEKSAGSTVRGNLLIDNQGEGVDTKNATGGHTIENNEITGNGVGGKESAGVRLQGMSHLVSRNEIYTNFGAGVMVDMNSTLNVISQNSMYDNGEINGGTGQIGIDLLELGNDNRLGTSPFVTLNDSGDGDGDANGLLNYPIIESMTLVAGNLVLTGYARPGSLIEFFIADLDPSGFGEGRTYLVSRTEGAAGDLDATVGSYGPGPINGIAQGQDTTNRFRFEVPPPAGVGGGTQLVATATLGGQTSEFSAQSAPLVAMPSLLVMKASLTLEDPHNGTTNPKSIPAAVIRYLVSVTNGGLGEVDDDSLTIADTIPSNTAIRIVDYDGSNPGPVAFVDGTTNSGLSYTFTNLGSDTDDVQFSNDNQANWDYIPLDIGDGTDPAVTDIRVNLSGTMVGSVGAGNPSFQVYFKVVVQ